MAASAFAGMKDLSSYRIIYLDTNHLSTLAGVRSDPSADELLALLGARRASLAISIAHFIELSAPTFQSVDCVKRLLLRIPVVIANIRERIFDEEVLAAYQQSLGLRPHQPRVFVERIEDWHDRSAPPGTVVNFLDAMIATPHLREETIRLATWAADLAALKQNSYVVQQPAGPLILKLRDDLPTLIGAIPQRTPDEILSAVGGLPGFPSYHVWHSLTLQRLTHPGFKTKPNDVLDEYHACYAPYLAVIALDRRTAFRLRQAALPSSSIVVHRLGDVLETLGLAP